MHSRCLEAKALCHPEQLLNVGLAVAKVLCFRVKLTFDCAVLGFSHSFGLLFERVVEIDNRSEVELGFFDGLGYYFGGRGGEDNEVAAIGAVACVWKTLWEHVIKLSLASHASQ